MLVAVEALVELVTGLDVSILVILVVFSGRLLIEQERVVYLLLDGVLPAPFLDFTDRRDLFRQNVSGRSISLIDWGRKKN